MDDELVHNYDAVKRREYYLRNRKLKGRTHGSGKPVAPVKTRAQRAAERRKHQEAQIAALKGRLEKLRQVLAAETKKAQARSGATSSTSASKTTSNSQSNTPKQKLTASQKAKKAAAEKKAREKNQTLDEQIKTLTEKVKTIQERIAKMRGNGSVGAKRTTTK
jgi:chromosome segregation ATPase